MQKWTKKRKKNRVQRTQPKQAFWSVQPTSSKARFFASPKPTFSKPFFVFWLKRWDEWGLAHFCGTPNLILPSLSTFSAHLTSFFKFPMDTTEIELILEGNEFLKSYEFAYSVYMYFILFVSLFLSLIIYYYCFNKKSKLSKELKILSVHSLTTNLVMTIVVCLSQVGFLD